MKNINLVCFTIIGLCLTASLTMPSTITPVSPINLAETSEAAGEVKGKQTQNSSQPTQPKKMNEPESMNEKKSGDLDLADLDLASDDNRPVKIDEQSEKLNKSESFTSPLPKKETTINLLAEPTQLIDQSLTIAVSNHPQLSEGGWTLQITADLATEEELIGFDRPGLTISFDQKLILQRTAQEIRKNNKSAKSEQTFSFNFSQLAQLPNELTIWAGNEGDQLQPTSAKVQAISLQATNLTKNSPVTRGNLKVYQDDAQYTTLSWTGGHSCLTQVKYGLQPINQDNWNQAQLIDSVRGLKNCPLIIEENNFVLIEDKPGESGYFAVGTVNAQGRLKALFTEDN